MRGLRSAPAGATASIDSFHLFPFGGLRKASQWLRDYGHNPLQPMERAAGSGTGYPNP